MYITFRLGKFELAGATRNEYLCQETKEYLKVKKGLRICCKKFRFISGRGFFIYNNTNLNWVHWKTGEKQ